MAKTSTVNRNTERIKLVAKQKAKRDALRIRSKDLKLTLEERMEARAALDLLPKDGSATRIKNRCLLTGRSHAYLRKFGVCRNALRVLVHQGSLPGVRKASW